MISRPDFMIVSGNGRNTGKTSFVSEVIRKISQKQAITAIKVSPHYHNDKKQEALFEGEGFFVLEEKKTDGIKDSSRMLQSGASQVFYIEAKDDSLRLALDQLLPKINPGHAVICESGGMRKLIEPSLTLLLNEEGRDEYKTSYQNLLPLADATVIFKGDGFVPGPETIVFDGKQWKLNQG